MTSTDSIKKNYRLVAIIELGDDTLAIGDEVLFVPMDYEKSRTEQGVVMTIEKNMWLSENDRNFYRVIIKTDNDFFILEDDESILCGCIKKIKGDVMSTDKISPKWLLNVKATIRPFITYIITILYFYVILKHKHYSVDIINIVYGLNIIILMYWYSERVLRNIGITDVLTKGNHQDLTDNHDPKWINRIKSTVRPFLTYGYTFLFIYVIWKHKEYKIEIIRDVATIYMLIILFWFGERWLKNIGAAEAIKRYFGKSTVRGVDKYEEALDIKNKQ